MAIATRSSVGWLNNSRRLLGRRIHRTPSGALFEYCWSNPASWAVDEPEDQLGRTFHVPPMFADREQEFIEYLEPLETGTPVSATTR